MQGTNEINSVNQQVYNITANQFKAKFADKPETYKFLAYEVGAYLPHYDSVTIFHLRDLAGDKRKKILAQDVKKIFIPQYEGLTIEKMLFHARNYPQVMKCLPADQKEISKLPREYIGNVIYTCVGKPFRDWVDSKVKERNDKIIEKQNLTIEMDKETYEAFMASTHVSGKCYRSGQSYCVE